MMVSSRIKLPDNLQVSKYVVYGVAAAALNGSVSANKIAGPEIESY